MKFMLAMLALLPLPAFSQNAADDLADVVQIEMLPGWRQDDGTHVVAVRMTISNGWYTYWRVSGGTGIPPRLSYAGSTNVAKATILWPRPVVMNIHSDTVIGYVNELILPIEILPAHLGQDVTLRATVDFGVCSDLCVPVTAAFDVDLSASDLATNVQITSALSRIPSVVIPGEDLAVTCQVTPLQDGVHLTARVKTPPMGTGQEIAVVEYPNPDLWIALPDSERQGDTLVLSVDVMNYSDTPFIPDPADFRITLLGADRALDIWGCDAPAG